MQAYEYKEINFGRFFNTICHIGIIKRKRQHFEKDKFMMIAYPEHISFYTKHSIKYLGMKNNFKSLKININLKPNEAEDSIKNFNFAFMFAPNYHFAMKYVAPIRKKIGKRTIFKTFTMVAKLHIRPVKIPER